MAKANLSLILIRRIYTSRSKALPLQSGKGGFFRDGINPSPTSHNQRDICRPKIIAEFGTMVSEMKDTGQRKEVEFGLSFYVAGWYSIWWLAYPATLLGPNAYKGLQGLEEVLGNS